MAISDELNGKVSLVTGGSGDIGGAIAKRLGQSGSTVVITAASSSLNWGPEDGAALSLDNLIAIEATGSKSTVKSDVDRSEGAFEIVDD